MKLLSLGAMFSLALTITACGGPPFEIAPDYAITLPGTLGSDPAADAGDPAVDAGSDPVVMADSGAVAPDSASDTAPDSGVVGYDSGSGTPEPDSGIGTEPVDAGHAEPDANSSHDACVLTVHTDGIGDTWTDCEPIGTMTEAEAMRACAADKASAGLPASGCVAYVDTLLEACGGPASAVCTGPLAPTSDDQACWVYQGTVVPTLPGQALHVTANGCNSDGTWQ